MIPLQSRCIDDMYERKLRKMPDYLVHVWTKIVNISWADLFMPKSDQICCHKIFLKQLIWGFNMLKENL